MAYKMSFIFAEKSIKLMLSISNVLTPRHLRKLSICLIYTPRIHRSALQLCLSQQAYLLLLTSQQKKVMPIYFITTSHRIFLLLREVNKISFT